RPDGPQCQWQPSAHAARAGYRPEPAIESRALDTRGRHAAPECLNVSGGAAAPLDFAERESSAARVAELSRKNPAAASLPRPAENLKRGPMRAPPQRRGAGVRRTALYRVVRKPTVVDAGDELSWRYVRLSPTCHTTLCDESSR